MRENQESPWAESAWVNAKDLIGRIKELIAEGRARSVILWSEKGNKLLEIPLHAGIALGGVALILAPFLSVLTAIVALGKRVRLEVVLKDDPRSKDDDSDPV